MKLVWHIARKDLRRLAWPLAGWLAFVVGSTLAFRALSIGAAVDAEESPLRWVTALDAWSRVLIGLQVAAGYVLTGALVLEDAVAGSQSFWMARPVSRWRLFAAKLLAAGLAFVVAPAVALAPLWAANGFSGAEIAAAACDFMFWQIWVTVPALAIATLARDLRGFLLFTGGIGVAYFACTAYFVTARWVEPLDLMVRRSRNVVVQFAFVPGAAVVLAHQIFSRRTRVAWLGVGAGLLVLLWVRLFWPWNFWPQACGWLQGWPAPTSAEERAVAVRVAPARADQPATYSAAINAPNYAPLAAIGGGSWRLGPGATWGEDAARRALGARSSSELPRWQMAVRDTRVAASDDSGVMLVGRVAPSVVGELPLVAGAQIARGASRTRIAALVRTDEGLTALLEDYDATAMNDGWSIDPRDTWSRQDGRRDCYLLVDRAGQVVRAAPLTEITKSTMNGFSAHYRRLELGAVEDGARLVKVRFEATRAFAQRFTFEEGGRR